MWKNIFFPVLTNDPHILDYITAAMPRLTIDVSYLGENACSDWTEGLPAESEAFAQDYNVQTQDCERLG